MNPPKCYISEEDSDTNACIWVGIISVPDKFQSLLVIRPFRTYQNLISQTKLQRKLIKMEIHRRITVCCQCSMGKNCLASSPNTGISIILLYVDCPHQFILRTAGGKNNYQSLQQRCRNLNIFKTCLKGQLDFKTVVEGL